MQTPFSLGQSTSKSVENLKPKHKHNSRTLWGACEQAEREEESHRTFISFIEANATNNKYDKVRRSLRKGTRTKPHFEHKEQEKLSIFKIKLQYLQFGEFIVAHPFNTKYS